jgi:5-methyltetrahydrofolate--homocysteine methyltransferase
MSTAARHSLAGLVATRRCVVSDGAIGTMIQAAGLDDGTCGELWNLEAPERVRAIHQAYADAGASFLTTNTFGGTSVRLELSGLAGRTAEVNREGARIAREVADAAGILVAGDVGPTGELIEPLGTLSAARARELFAEQVAALVEGGADLILIETMSDLAEMEAAVLAAQDAAPGREIVATMSFDTNRHTMMGVSPAQAVQRMAELGVTAAGANCGRGLDDIEAVMADMAAARPDGILLIAQSNAGLPHLHGDSFVYDVSAGDMAGYALRLRDLGVEVIGGCCGSTPEHVRAMAQALAG